MKYSFLLAILIISGFILGAQIAFAGTAKLAWDPNTESDLAGYRIYYGTSTRTGDDPKNCGLCGYSNKVDVGNVTTYTFNNLPEGFTYYFSVTAYDTSGNESAFSNEVSKSISGEACGDGNCSGSENCANCPADCGSCRKGDLNGDGSVNSLDYSLLVSKWFQTQNIENEDLNKDGKVNVRDLGILMSNWTG